MLGEFIAGDFIAITGEMRRFPASNENTGWASVDHIRWAYVGPTL